MCSAWDKLSLLCQVLYICFTLAGGNVDEGCREDLASPDPDPAHCGTLRIDDHRFEGPGRMDEILQCISIISGENNIHQ